MLETRSVSAGYHRKKSPRAKRHAKKSNAINPPIQTRISEERIIVHRIRSVASCRGLFSIGSDPKAMVLRELVR